MNYDIPDESEQWKNGGDCNKCRRKKYCTKPCKLNRYRQKEHISKITYKMFGTTLMKLDGMGINVEADLSDIADNIIESSSMYHKDKRFYKEEEEKDNE